MVNFGVFIIVLVLADVVITKEDLENSVDSQIEAEAKKLIEAAEEKKLKKIKKKHNSRSTSSSEGKKAGDGSNDADNSLDLSDSGRSVSKTGEKKKAKNVPKSTEERTGWRKWHRKCTRCLADEKKKWRDPTISWICGGYQQARRSFKSECMMFYRNCQDGTMFIKIRDHRCPNDTGKETRHGDHFFYEYKVVLTDEERDSDETESNEDAEAAASSSY